MDSSTAPQAALTSNHTNPFRLISQLHSLRSFDRSALPVRSSTHTHPPNGGNGGETPKMPISTRFAISSLCVLLGLFRLLQRCALQQLCRDVLEEARHAAHHEAEAAVEHVYRIRQVQLIARACARDVHQPPLLFDFVVANALRSWEASVR